MLAVEPAQTGSNEHGFKRCRKAQDRLQDGNHRPLEDGRDDLQLAGPALATPAILGATFAWGRWRRAGGQQRPACPAPARTACRIAAYGNPDWADLAACCGVGLAKNHPFVDGNKRAAFLAVGLFLRLNGRRLAATPAEATLVMLDAAAGAIDEACFARWIRDDAQRR